MHSESDDDDDDDDDDELVRVRWDDSDRFLKSTSNLPAKLVCICGLFGMYDFSSVFKYC